MAIYKITTPAKVNTAASVVGDYKLFLPNRVNQTLTTAMFTTLTKPVYKDPDNDNASYIKILSLPITPGTVQFNGINVTIGLEISVTDINSGLLLYNAPNQNSLASNQFIFTIKDSGSNTYSSDTGIFTIFSAKVVVPTNHPPTVNDKLSLLNSEQYQFVLTDFINNFTDFDGDSYELVTVVNLPAIGIILYNNLPISIGFEFNLADIGNLTFEMPNNTILSSDGYCQYPDNVDTIISSYTNQGYIADLTQKGILKFVKEVSNSLPNNTDIYAFFDATSMKITNAQSAQTALNAWYIDFKNTNPLFTGSLYILPVMKENWLGFPTDIIRGSLAAVGNNWDRPADDYMAFAQIPPNFDIDTNNVNPLWTAPTEVLMLAFIDEVDTGSHVNGTAYHRDRNGYGFEEQPSAQYLSDYKDFRDNYTQFAFFKALFYPIPDIDAGSYNNTYNACVLQGFAAIEGGATYKLAEIENLGVTYAAERRFDRHLDPSNSYYTGTDSYVANPYSEEAHTPVPNSIYELQGLNDFGWVGIYDKDQPASNAFSVQVFTDDLNSYLQGSTESFTDIKFVQGVCSLLQEICFDFKTSDNSIDNLYSNVATFCFDINGQVGNSGSTGNAPTVSDNSSMLRTNVFNFSSLSFVKNFADTDGNQANEVTIKSLPRLGTLKLLGNDVVIGNKFINVNAGLLEYHLKDDLVVDNGIVYQFTASVDSIIALYENAGYRLDTTTNGELIFIKGTSTVTIKGVIISSTINFLFTINDNSSGKLESNQATYTLIPEGKINIPTNTAENQAPTVGDNVVNTQYDYITTLYRWVFTDTQPRFSDPEGDQPFKLKILSLPENGVLLYDSVPVIIGQIFDFIDDIDTGRLVFDPDDTKEYYYEITFDFTISDTVSKKFA